MRHLAIQSISSPSAHLSNVTNRVTILAFLEDPWVDEVFEMLKPDELLGLVKKDLQYLQRPSLAQLGIPFVLESGAATSALLEEFSVTQKSAEEIRRLLESCDRTLVFS